MSLFRNEALRHQQQRYFGSIVLRSPKLFVWLTVAAVALSALLLSLLVWGTYTRRVSLSGYVIPEAGILRVHSPLAGRVATLHVHEGQEVEAGNPLLTVLDERFRGSGPEVRGAMAAQIEARQRNLRQVLAEQRLLYQRTRLGLQSRMEALERELAQLDQEKRTLQQRLEQAIAMEHRFQDLRAQGFASIVQVQEKSEATLELRYRIQMTERNHTSVSRELRSATTELDVLPMRERSQLAELERSLQSSEQELIDAQSRRELVVRASTTGRVTSLSTKPGAMVDPQKPLMTLVPSEQGTSALEVHLFAPSKDAGFVRTGQSVRLRYHAFPFQKFGHYEGVVREVSGTPLLPAELPYPLAVKPDTGSLLAGLPTLPPNDAMYRIRVVPKSSSITAYGQPISIQPGMQVEADVMLDTRNLWEWIFEPLMSIRGKYF